MILEGVSEKLLPRAKSLRGAGQKMPTLPARHKNVVLSPHIVLLGAGASIAACPHGDTNGKKLPTMNNFVDILDLYNILNQAGILYEGQDFETVYDELASNERTRSIAKVIEDRIQGYFSGMELPNEPTAYDYLILSLREKDIIASFNWDPLLLQAYRRNLQIQKLPHPVFLHGNVGMGVCQEDRRVGYANTLCDKCMNPLGPARLLYPVKHKHYSSDILIQDQWNRLRDHLRIGYWLTIFGYSAPISDVDAQALMLEAWKNNTTRELAQVEIIDIKSDKELKESWNTFIVREHYGICRNLFDSYLLRYPRRSCEALAAATLMNKPWKENRIPKLKTVAELHAWLQPLLEEETKYEQYKEPFRYMSE